VWCVELKLKPGDPAGKGSSGWGWKDVAGVQKVRSRFIDVSICHQVGKTLKKEIVEGR